MVCFDINIEVITILSVIQDKSFCSIARTICYTKSISTCDQRSPKMDISLHPKHEEFINQQIQLGEYATVDEAVGAAVHLLQLNDLRQKVQIGTAQIAAGQVTDGDRVFANIQTTLNKSQALDM